MSMAAALAPLMRERFGDKWRLMMMSAIVGVDPAELRQNEAKWASVSKLVVGAAERPN